MMVYHGSINKMQPKNPNPQCSHVCSWDRCRNTEMQSHKTLLQNKLFQKSCTFFPCYRTSVDCGVWHGVECRVWSVKTVECSEGNVVCRV